MTVCVCVCVCVCMYVYIYIYIYKIILFQSQKSTGYGAHPAAIATKLKAIDEKIKAHQEMLSKPVSFSGTKTMTRHEMDLELAITHNEEKAKLLGSLLIEGNTLDPSYEDKNHPINHLDDILEEALTKRRPQSNHKLKDSAVESHSVVEEHSSVISKSDINNEKERRSTLEDKLEPMTEATCQPKPKVVKRSDEYIYLPESTDSKEHLVGSSRVSEAKNRKINGHIDLIPEEAICRYRLSVQEIKKLDRFTNYEPGLPSNVSLNVSVSLNMCVCVCVSHTRAHTHTQTLCLV